jgi:hypothetical protein
MYIEVVIGQELLKVYHLPCGVPLVHLCDITCTQKPEMLIDSCRVARYIVMCGIAGSAAVVAAAVAVVTIGSALYILVKRYLKHKGTCTIQ